MKDTRNPHSQQRETVCYKHSASSIWKLFLSFAINPVNNNLPKRIDKEDHDSLAVLRPVLDLF